MVRTEDKIREKIEEVALCGPEIDEAVALYEENKALASAVLQAFALGFTIALQWTLGEECDED